MKNLFIEKAKLRLARIAAPLLFFLIISSTAYAQPSAYYFTKDMGQVNDVLETQLGEAWVATDIGVFQFTNYGNQVTSHSLSTFVSPVYVLRAQDTTIWAGTFFGLYRYDGRMWHPYTTADGLSGDSISDIEIDIAGNLWLLADGTVNKFDGTTFTTYPITGNSIAMGLTKLYVGTESTTESCHVYDGTTWSTLPSIPGFFYDRSFNTIVDANQVLWNKHFNGVSKYENNAWTTVLTQTDNSSLIATSGSSIYVGSELNRGLPLVNTDIYKVTGTNVDTLTELNYDFRKRFTSICTGINGALWLAESNVDWVNSSQTHSAVKFFPEMYDMPASDKLTVNNISTGFMSKGDLFKTIDRTNSRFGEGTIDYGEFKVGGITGIFESTFWLKGVNVGKEYVSASTGAFGSDFYSGPISNQYDSAYIAKYNRVWKVTKAEIETHKAQYANSAYTMPDAIALWPGNGNTQHGEAQFLAPFADYNFNGVYEPYLGEHPDIRGDEAIFFMINDTRGPQMETDGEGMGIEVHALAYVYDTTATHLNNSVFMSLRVYNRSQNDYTGFKMGLWTDFDLGRPSDDVVGSDSINGIFYVYNGDSDDDGPNGFGLNPPAIGGLFLNDTLSGYMAYTNANNNPAVTPPTLDAAYLLYMNQYWQDGKPLTWGGTGYDPTSTSSRTKFHFNDQANWRENPSNQADRRGLATNTERTLLAQSDYCVDMVLIYARDSTGDPFGSVDKMKVYAQDVRTFYQSKSYDCLGIKLSDEEDVLETTFDIYPNPISAGGILQLHFSTDISSISIHNTNGNRILKNEYTDTSETTLYIPDYLSPGLYVVSIQLSDKTVNYKLIVQ